MLWSTPSAATFLIYDITRCGTAISYPLTSEFLTNNSYVSTGIVSELFKYIKYIGKHKTAAPRDYYPEHERELLNELPSVVAAKCGNLFKNTRI